jgi:hypothetical protein
MAAVKEVEFWKLQDAFNRLDEYAAHFRAVGNAKAIGEYSARYLSLPDVSKRLCAVLPDVKLIVALRNPMEQVTSNFWHLHRQRFNLHPGERVPQNLAEALANDSHREILLSPARYGSHLERYYSVFPREQIHVICFDDIVKKPRDVLGKLFVFLEVNPTFEPPSFHECGSKVRKGTSPKSARSARIHERVYGGLVDRIYNPLKRVIGVRRAAKIKETLRVRHIMERIFMRKGYPPPSGLEVTALRMEFREEITKFKDLTGLSLSGWE